MRFLMKIVRLFLCGILLVSCTTTTKADDNTKLISQWKPPVQQVALLLPLQGNLGNAGQAIRDGFMSMYYQTLAKDKNPPVIKIYNTADGRSINTIYQQAISEGAKVVIGPLDKASVADLQNAGNFPVPTIALNDTTNQQPIQNLYQFGLSPLDEARQVADKAAADGHHQALLIYPQGAWGQAIAQTLTKRWEKEGGTIVDSLAVSDNDPAMSQKIAKLLQVHDGVPRHDMDVIFLIASPITAREIKPLLKFYFVDNVPVYGASLLYTGLSHPNNDLDLNGVQFCDMPFVLDSTGPWAKARAQWLSTWPVALQSYVRLFALGMDAELLSAHLNDLGASPQQGLPGATGTLYRDSANHIWRQLKWATFVNGQAVEQ